MEDLFIGKTALISGGTSGIGFATAKRLIQNGAEVVIIGRTAPKLAAAVEELGQFGKASGWLFDIANSAEAQAAVELIAGKLEHVSLLVNAAGIFNPKPFVEQSEADYDSYHQINRGTFFITQQVVKNMQAANLGGAIVNVGSMWAHQAVKATPSSSYSMAKAGLHSLTQHLAMELAESGIRVNAVAPAVVETPVYEAFIPLAELKETLRGFDSFHPLGRIGTPEDIAKAVVFLLSDNASWITGETLNVDGGVMAGRN